MRTLLSILGLGTLLAGCTVTRMGSRSGPPRIESDGLMEGHAAFGFRKDRDFLRLDVLDGRSNGAVAEFVLWKLFRLEVGALGLGIGLGPIDLALGAAFYDPEVPEMHGGEAGQPAEAASVSGSDCELCKKAQ